MMVNITFRSMDETTFTCSMDTSTSVRRIKAFIELYNGSPANSLRLIYRGQLLKDDYTLDSYNITTDNTIHVVCNNPPNANNNNTENNANNMESNTNGTVDNTNNMENNTQNNSDNGENYSTNDTNNATNNNNDQNNTNNDTNTSNNGPNYSYYGATNTSRMVYGIPMGIYMSPIYTTVTVPDNDTANADTNNTSTAGAGGNAGFNNLGTLVSRVITTAVNSFISNLGPVNTGTHTYTNTPNPNNSFNQTNNTPNANTNNTANTFNATNIPSNGNNMPSTEPNTDSVPNTVNNYDVRIENVMIQELDKINFLVNQIINSLIVYSSPRSNTRYNNLQCKNINQMLNELLEALELRLSLPNTQTNLQNNMIHGNNSLVTDGNFISRFQNILVNLISEIRLTLTNNSVEVRERYKGLIEVLLLIINLLVQVTLQFYLQYLNTSPNSSSDQFLSIFQNHINNNTHTAHTANDTTNGVNNGMDDTAEIDVDENDNIMAKYTNNQEFKSKMDRIKKIKFSNSYHM